MTSRVGALSAFTKKKETCLGCKAVLPTGQEKQPLCQHCAKDEARLYLAQMQRYRSMEERFSRLWTECQRCQGSLHEEVLCTSRDCPIFYMRKKVQMELIAQDKNVQRFGNPSW